MEDDIYKHIGRRIREERNRRGWTQEQLAEKVEMHLSFIGQLERGAKKPSLRTLKRIADALGVRAGDLLDESLPSVKPYPMERKFADLIRNRSQEQQRVLYQTLRQLARQAKKISGK